MMMIENKIFDEALKEKEWIIDIRRQFHMYPEFGLEEHMTSKMICERLSELGVEYRDKVAKTGVVGIIRGELPGKTIAIRADIDGLPIKESNNLEYKSKNEGMMHACGHDAHIAIVLCIAKILSKKTKRLKGNIKLIFQPAEETVGGAKTMIEEGVMKNPNVDYVLGLHVSNEINVGQIGIKYGAMNASSDSFKIIVNGESTHGAYPHSGIDSIMIAGQLINSIQGIVSRNVDPRDSAVVTIGTINGGKRENIIANHVEMRGTMRTLCEETRKKIKQRLTKIVKNITAANGGIGEVFFDEGYTSLINHDKIVEIVKKSGIEILGKENVKLINSPSMGVDDFAFFLNEAPGAYFKLGTRNEAKNIIHDGHSCDFNIDEEALVIGTAIQLSNIYKLLGE